MKLSQDTINTILSQHLGAERLVSSLSEHEWSSEEDATFIGITVSKYIIDLMSH